MAEFTDPSIISMVSAPNQETSRSNINIENRNDINSFLREAENKRDEEEESKRDDNGSRSSNTTSQTGTEGESQTEATEPVEEEDEETKALRKQQELENWKLDLGPYNDEERLRYSADFLYSLKDSEDNFVPPGLPPKSYYRLKNKPPQRPNWSGNQNNNNNNTNNNNGNYSGRNNYNEGGSATGAMGNFNLNRRTHDRGFNRHGGNHNNHNNHRRNNNNRDNRHHKKNTGEDDDSWLAEFDKDAVQNAEGFEAYRARVKQEERKRNGELLDTANDASLPQSSEPKNTIDSQFRAVKPSLTSNPSGGATDSGRKSKFLGIFSQGPQQSSDSNPSTKPAGSSSDGVSKILSLLDSGEKNAQAGSNNSTPQIAQASISTPNEQPTGFNSQRSQFFGQGNKTASAGSTPMLPPGLTPPSGSQAPPNLPTGGSKDSFFMSLLNKAPDGGQPESQTQSPVVTTRSPALPKNDSSRTLPPGLQAPPGLTQHTPAQNQSQQSQSQQQPSQHSQQQQQHPQGQPQNPGFPPGFPPQFQSSQNRPPQGPGPQGQFINPPPGFNPQQPPPWLTQQMAPNLQQGRFMPPPLPNNVGFPPQFRPQGGPQGGPQGDPRLLFPPQEFQGNPNGPPVFLPPFNGPAGPDSNTDSQQRERFPPGFFNGGPPPGFGINDLNKQ